MTVVIPARNEARNLPWVLAQVPGWVDEVIVVDGHSTDVTMAKAASCREGVRLVTQTGHGKGAGLRAGFEASTGEIIVMLDSDGSMAPQELPHLLHFLDHGYDFVKGSRFVAGGGSLDITPLRSIGNRLLMQLVSRLYGEQLTDLCYGYIAFRREWLPFLELRSDGFEIETEMILRAVRAGLRIAEVPSLELPRRSGRSGLRTFRDGFRVLRTVVAERRRPACAVGSTEAPDRRRPASPRVSTTVTRLISLGRLFTGRVP